MSKQIQVLKLPVCDVCDMNGEVRDAKYDCKTRHGCWGNLCQECFEVYGIKLGTGWGQELILKKG